MELWIKTSQAEADSLHNHFAQIGATGRMYTLASGITGFEWEPVGPEHLKRLAAWSEHEAILIAKAQAGVAA